MKALKTFLFSVCYIFWLLTFAISSAFLICEVGIIFGWASAPASTVYGTVAVWLISGVTYYSLHNVLVLWRSK